MKNLLLKAFACLLFIQLSSCQSYSQKRISHDLSGFTSLSASAGIDVYLTQGNAESVEIEADEAILEDLIVEVDGNNTLVIKIDRDFWDWVSNTGSIKAYVTFKNLEEIDVSGGSDLRGEGSMEFEALKLNVSGGADMNLALKADELEVNSSGGSDVILAGYARYFQGNSSGGSDIKAQELETEIAEVSASGGSDAHISVSKELKANASGGSDVFYYGDPEKVDSDASGGSDVSKR